MTDQINYTEVVGTEPHIWKALQRAKLDGCSILFPVRFYFDESGIHAGSPAFVLAGYLGTVEKWARFELRWLAVLEAHEVTEFHMTDFESRHGQYKGWSNEKRISFLSALLDIINETAMMGICCVITTQDYEAVIPEAARKKYGLRLAYSLCFIECLGEIERWGEDLQSKESIEFICDQMQGWTAIENTFFKFREIMGNPKFMRSGIRFQDHRDNCQLQSADVLAYELYKHLENTESGFLRSMRKSLERLDMAKVSKKKLTPELLKPYVDWDWDTILPDVFH